MAMQYLAMDLAVLGGEIDVRENAAEMALLRQVDSPFDLEESRFCKLFRLTPDSVYSLTDSIGHCLEKKTISALSAEIQVLAALRFYATGCYQRPIGEQSRIFMSQSSISRSIHRVTDAINEQIFRQHVRYPMTAIERQAARSLFRTAPEPFNGAIGAIDCTHVAIIGPSEHEEAFVNHHGYHSINVQMICDPNLKILNVNARYPGARHDSYIWSACAAREAMKRAYDRGDKQTFLIGDSGYPLEPWLMTPLQNQPEGTPPYKYNEALCKARNCVERLFGVLKSRWRCLSRQRVLMYEPDFAGRIVNACAVLHNLSLNTLNVGDILLNNLPNIESQNITLEEIEEQNGRSIAKRMQERLIAQNFA